MSKVFNIYYYDLLVPAYRLGLPVDVFVIHFAIGAGISSRIANHDMDYEGER